MNCCSCRQQLCPYGYEVCQPTGDNADLKEIVRPKPRTDHSPANNRDWIPLARLLPNAWALLRR